MLPDVNYSEMGLLVTGAKFSVHLLVLILDTQVPSIVTTVTVSFS